MKSKTLLRFYFGADRLNAALDGFIFKRACASAHCDCLGSIERVISLVDAKRCLSSLWGYLDGVMASFSGNDRAILRGYALSRRGYSGLERSKANAVRRVVVRFMRRANRLGRYAEELDQVMRYRMLFGG